MGQKISYDIAGTVNLGNFENVKVGFGFEGDIFENETKEQAIERITQFVEENWQKRIEAAVEAFREST